jgi:TatD DNase family protein
LDLAAELGLPVVIHTRDSMEEALDVLEPYARGGLKTLLHCWSGSVDQAGRVLGFGGLLGIGGVVTYKNAGALPEVVSAVPLSSLVLETDCPYLSPMPHRGKRNEPAYLPLIADRVAALHGVSSAEVARVTRQASLTFFARAM